VLPLHQVTRGNPRIRTETSPLTEENRLQGDSYILDTTAERLNGQALKCVIHRRVTAHFVERIEFFDLTILEYCLEYRTDRVIVVHSFVLTTHINEIQFATL
jgi:hypothetical protein